MRMEQTTHIFDVAKVEVEKVQGVFAPFIRIHVSDGSDTDFKLKLWGKKADAMPEIVVVCKDERPTVTEEIEEDTDV